MTDGAVAEATLSLVEDGRKTGVSLSIALLPNTPNEAYALLDLRRQVDRDSTLAPIQLLESTEYRFSITPSDSGDYTTDRPEIFLPDDRSGRTGRIRTGLATGLLPIAVCRDSRVVGHLSLEVRSRKLDYLRQYQWMMRDIAAQMSEVVMERFAPSEHHFQVEEAADARTLYQKFCFLKGLLDDEAFRAAVRLVLNRPYAQWDEREEWRNPARGIKGSSKVVRRLVAAGWRDTDANRLGEVRDRSQSSPTRIPVSVAHESLDNQPNRFVKFALDNWRAQVARVESALQRLPLSNPVSRGAFQVTAMLSELDELLANDLFRGIGELDQFPAASTILQQGEGYRDIYRAYLSSEFAAKLSWPGGEAVFGAGQRNVATLFEYWTFLQLATALAGVCGQSFDFDNLLRRDESGLSIGLIRGQQCVLTGSVHRLGRVVDVELWFNRTFSSGRRPGTSWARPMRPDCSVRLTPTGGIYTDVPEVWLHFDAKYRVESLFEILGPEAASADDETSGATALALDAGARRDDLMKMHAYRDAIRRSAGAYVLYPGSDSEKCLEYHELLPGLGAFGLQPTEYGSAAGIRAIEAFLNDSITHVASQSTQYERSRFWNEKSYEKDSVANASAPVARFLKHPPADALVLLGFVKSPVHLRWIEEHRLYNLRADSRRGAVGLTSTELSAELLILYGQSINGATLFRIKGLPRLFSSGQLQALSYPDPGGSLYYCVELEDEAQRLEYPLLKYFASSDVQRIGSRDASFGAPSVMTWQELTDYLHVRAP